MAISIRRLEIHFPSQQGDQLRIHASDGALIQSSTPSFPPDDLRADMLGARLWQSWANRASIMESAGLVLGSWLFGNIPPQVLQDCISQATDERPSQIALFVSEALSAWPWELSTLPGFQPFSIHPLLTLVRAVHSKRPASSTPQFLRVELVGVDLDESSNSGWMPLKTQQEISKIQSTIVHIKQLETTSDFRGDWEKLKKRFEENGAPDIFHFAGHGQKGGSGLIFSDASRRAVPIDAGQIVALLSSSSGEQCHLAVLNACHTAGSNTASLSPFGSICHRLSVQGVPNVVGVLNPMQDFDAKLFAGRFYEGLAQEQSVDVATQRARRELYLHANSSGAWGFISVSMCGLPRPIISRSRQPIAVPPEATTAHFGFEPQRRTLQRFLLGRRSMAVIVPGREGSGHMHVIRRVEADLARENRKLYQPIPLFPWMPITDPRVARKVLLDSIGHALNRRSWASSDEEYESEIIREIRRRCRDDKVLVFYPAGNESIIPDSEVEASALVSLIKEVWVRLVERLRDGSAFLLLPIAYVSDTQKNLVQQVITELKPVRRPSENVRIEVLDELQPIDKAYVQAFLEDALDMDSERAEKQARSLISKSQDNTRLIINVRTLIDNLSMEDSR